jgi:hypothetical protein
MLDDPHKSGSHHKRKMNIIRAVKSRTAKWKGHVVCMRVIGNTFKFLSELKERY